MTAAAPSGPPFRVHDIPFSTYGSWFAISPVVAPHTVADDLHLVSHQSGMHAVLRLVPVDPDGERTAAEVAANPSRLSWSGPEGGIELCYESPDTVRVRGTGLGLRVSAAVDELSPFSGTYFFRDPVDGSHTFTSYETGRRYRVSVLAGRAAAPAGAQAVGGGDRGLTLTADADGVWEAAIEELDSAREPYEKRDSFDAAVEAAAQAFSDFADQIAPWRSTDSPAAALAVYVLWSATVAPAGFLDRPAVLMSKHWMDKVWSWDHCFNALALAAGAPELAWDQFCLPFDFQDESGALPDSVTHSEVLYNFVKPPIHGWAFRLLRERLPEPLPTAELERIYDRLARWTSFWLHARRAPGSALPHYQHGNDSGWDNATLFDPERVVVAADLAAFLSQQLSALTEVATELGRDADALKWSRAYESVREALLGRLWTGDRFQARSAESDDSWSGSSLLYLMPIALGELLPGDVAEALARDISGHLTQHGLATERPDSPHYESDGYWRGPIWA
ncbi:MAG: amylo-alpha-1,6-glucosidase, partial [Catenulispora sp.]